MIHSYKLNGLNIVLDVASGAIHSVDDVAFDVIQMLERGMDESAIAARIKEAHNIADGEIAEIFSDIDELKRRGKLFSEDTFDKMPVQSGVVAPLKALCLNVSHVCNMTCGYCFAGRGEYHGGGLMSLETGKRAIDFLIENSGARKNLDVDFFGGEPLLNWDVAKAIVEYARGRELDSGKSFRFTLTTNGLGIDGDVIDFKNREMRNVVLSLDGRPEVNDAMRRLPSGRGGGTYDIVVPKFKKLIEARGGKDYYIRGTFTRENLDFVNDILHIADLGFRELSMEPVVAKPGSPYALTEDDLPKILEQYELLAVEMINRKKQGREFTFYHYTLDLTGGPCVHKRIAGCGVGTEYLAVTPQGELYPCHQFIGDEKFVVGDIWAGVSNEKLCEEFGCRNIYTTPECRDCWAKMYCSGGCAANNYNATGEITGAYKLGCEFLKKRVECAIMIKVAEAVGL